MKRYTPEEMQHIENEINNLILMSDRYSIRELCTKEEYALYYFTNKAMDSINTLNHIDAILKDKPTFLG